jgi:hypothetical protein
MLKTETLTAGYLNGKLDTFEGVLSERREGNGQSIVLRGCRGNNLKGIDVEFPLGKLICVTGVSGSGKSTLVNETLQPILSQKFYRSLKEPLAYDSIEGIDLIDKVVDVDQSPIGRSPRSNPATYTGVFSDIRQLFVELPESKIRAYKPGRFSFNVSGGRCEACGGNGIDWLKSAKGQVILVCMFLWKNLGYNMILFMSALCAIPRDIIEVADLEGASGWYKFVHIKLRYLSPTILFVLILSMINSFKIFREVYLLTGNYPQDKLYMLQHFMNNTFNSLDYQKLSAAAVLFALLMIVIMAVLLIVENIFGKDVE